MSGSFWPRSAAGTKRRSSGWCSPSIGPMLRVAIGHVRDRAVAEQVVRDARLRVLQQLDHAIERIGA